MGDQRVHDQVIALRAVETTDFMTADWYPFDGEFLKTVSRRIVNEVKGVCRVVYDSKYFHSFIWFLLRLGSFPLVTDIEYLIYSS